MTRDLGPEGETDSSPLLIETKSNWLKFDTDVANSDVQLFKLGRDL